MQDQDFVAMHCAGTKMHCVATRATRMHCAMALPCFEVKRQNTKGELSSAFFRWYLRNSEPSVPLGEWDSSLMTTWALNDVTANGLINSSSTVSMLHCMPQSALSDSLVFLWIVVQLPCTSCWIIFSHFSGRAAFTSFHLFAHFENLNWTGFHTFTLKFYSHFEILRSCFVMWTADILFHLWEARWPHG